MSSRPATAFAFPVDLAEQVVARWQTFVARHDRPAPPLPPAECLRHVLETAFFASFLREEGRELRFVLCCAPGTEVPRDGVDEAIPVVPLGAPRPLALEALRSLAPAVSADNAAILVTCPTTRDDPAACQIAGVLNIGSHLARGRAGRSFYHRPAPHALLVDVRDAGELHIYRAGTKLAMLKAGRLHDHLAFSGLEFFPISDILTPGSEALRPRIRPPAREPQRETSDFEWTALLGTVLALVNGIKEHGHGGVLLISTPGSEGTMPVRIKFDVSDRNTMLTDCFVDFLNARHELTGLQPPGVPRDPLPDPAVSTFEKATFVAEEDLADAVDLVARLSAVDGALVLSSDLRLVGFGAEIVLDATQPIVAFEASGRSSRAGDLPEVDSESFGMRHRSALRCVAVADHTAAFVVSQDGVVSFFWKENGRVLVKRDVGTENPIVLGG